MSQSAHDSSGGPAVRRAHALGWEADGGDSSADPTTVAGDELKRLREENRRLAISLGGFSAFIASRGLLEDAWHFIHNIHQEDEGRDRE